MPARTSPCAATSPWRSSAEAKAAGFDTRPVLLGPVSFLLLSKTTDGSDRLALLERLLPVYAQLLERLHVAGAAWVQIDEPTLALDLDEAAARPSPAPMRSWPRRRAPGCC